MEGRRDGYRFRLLDAAASPVAALNTTIGGTLDPWQMHVYQFSGVAGQTLFVATGGAGACALQISVAGPTGMELDRACAGTFLEITLPSDGTYFVSLSNQEGAANPYSFRLNMAAVSVTPIADLNADVLGTISEPGEADVWTFAGAVGLQFVADVVDFADSSLSVRLVSPSGALIDVFTPWDDGRQVTLLESGTYRVEVDPWGDAVGDYRFRLIAVTAAPELPMNEPLAGTLAPGTPTHVYRFEGLANQEIHFEAAAAGFCDAWMSLWGPGDQVLADDCVPGEFQVVLPVSGTYALTIAGLELLSDVAYTLQANTCALRAADMSAGTPAGPSDAASLTDAALAALWAEAQRRWSLVGVGGSALRAAVSGVRLVVDDLPAGYLGLITRNTMHLDRDAAGRGWFVDDIPWDDDEFDYLSDPPSTAARGASHAAGRYDLLTVLMHELGHLLGATHAQGDSDSLFDELLPAGRRRAPSEADCDAWFRTMGDAK